MSEDIDLRKLFQGINSELDAFHRRLNELEGRIREVEVMLEVIRGYLCEED